MKSQTAVSAPDSEISDQGAREHDGTIEIIQSWKCRKAENGEDIILEAWKSVGIEEPRWILDLSGTSSGGASWDTGAGITLTAAEARNLAQFILASTEIEEDADG